MFNFDPDYLAKLQNAWKHMPFMEQQQRMRESLMPFMEHIQRNQELIPLISKHIHSFNPLMSKLALQTDIIDRIAPCWNTTSPDWIDEEDLLEIEYDEDKQEFIFDGTTYSPDELNARFDEEAEEAKKQLQSSNPSKFRLIKFLYNLLMLYIAIPNVADSTGRYGDWISSLITTPVITKEASSCVYVWTTAERTRLRDKPNQEGTIIQWLLIETELRVISDDIQRWYEVEHTTKDGEVVTGWVPKRYVERTQ